jgi:hypothetical protein
MKPDFWQIQSADKPLFPKLEWSRPENKMHAGKLLVIGGNLHGFAAPAEAYAEAQRAGAGSVRALLPDAIKKFVGVMVPEADYAPSTPVSDSFSQKALDDFLSASAWADGVLIAGDLGRNAETAILLEKYLSKSPVAVTLTKDAVDYAASAPGTVLNRENTTLVLSLAQLQRLGTAAKFAQPVLFSMDLLHLVEWLHAFTAQFTPNIIVKHHDHIAVAVNGQVSTTKLTPDPTRWRLKTATHAAVWHLQHPTKPFEALTAAVFANSK